MKVIRWTPEEDSDLLECVNITTESGDTLESGLKAFSDMTTRSVHAARVRYYKLKITDFQKEEVEPIIEISPQQPLQIQVYFEGLQHEFNNLMKECAKLQKQNVQLRAENKTFIDAFNLVRQKVTGTQNEFAYSVESDATIRRENK